MLEMGMIAAGDPWELLACGGISHAGLRSDALGNSGHNPFNFMFGSFFNM